MNQHENSRLIDKQPPQNLQLQNNSQFKIVPWDLLVTIYGLMIGAGVIYRIFNP